MAFRAMQVYTRGASHIKEEKVRQDYSGYSLLNRKEEGGYVIGVVADGHGSSIYTRSERGAKFAVKAALSVCRSWLAALDQQSGTFGWDGTELDRKQDLRELAARILEKWRAMIRTDLGGHHLTEEEKQILSEQDAGEYVLYGTTLIVSVITDDFYCGICIGDGSYVVVEEDGTLSVPVEDKHSFANYTTSLCEDNVIDKVEVCCGEKKPAAIYVATDGLIKTFSSIEDLKIYHLIWTTMLDDEKSCRTKMRSNIQDRTVHGSGDDISVVCIYDSEMVSCGKKLYTELIQSYFDQKRGTASGTSHITPEEENTHERGQ